jgi:hypothetical protein
MYETEVHFMTMHRINQNTALIGTNVHIVCNLFCI